LEIEKTGTGPLRAAFPGLGEIIRIVLDKEEANARRLSSFPHLLLPGPGRSAHCEARSSAFSFRFCAADWRFSRRYCAN
jgi:hypothetical protein